MAPSGSSDPFDDVPESVRQFVLSTIDSVELLRVLLLLFEAPSRRWSAADITRELRSSDSSIDKRLHDLYDRRVLSPEANRDAVHQYIPYSGESHAAVEKLVDFHRHRPYRLIDLIYSKPNEALRAFADAFKIKKDRG